MGPVLAKFALSYKRKKREADSINWERGRERERERAESGYSNSDPINNPTGSHFTISATSPVEQGTDQKLGSRPSLPYYHHCQKMTRALAIKLRSLRLFYLALPRFLLHFGCTTGWVLFLSSPSSFSVKSHHLKRPDCYRSTFRGITTLGAWSAAIAAHGRSLLAPLNSTRLEVSNLSFPITID